MYSFKVYFNDGTTSYVGGKGKRPTLLYNDFDSLMNEEELDKLDESKLTTKEILELAFNIYKDFLKKNYYRIEIVNITTNEIIDYIEN